MSICLIRWRLFSVESRSCVPLLGFAVSIDCFATAYRLRRLMLQSHSRTLFLLFAITVAGFVKGQSGMTAQPQFEIIRESGSMSEAFILNQCATERRRWQRNFGTRWRRYDNRLGLLWVRLWLQLRLRLWRWQGLNLCRLLFPFQRQK